MPSWKKVITSGSDAALNSINVTNGLTITGSLNHFGNYNHTGSVTHSGSKFLNGIFVQTGSLSITGSTTQVGNNTLLGTTTLSGSIIISGSTTVPETPTIKVNGDMETDGVIKFLPVVKNINTSISASYIYVSGSTSDLYFSQNGSGYNNVTRLRWLEGNLYTGLLNGGLITTASSTVYRISSGSGIIVNLNASLTDNPYPTIQYLNWGNLSASISAFTASYQQVFVGIDSTGNIFAQGTPFSNGQFDSIINIGGVFFQNQSTINGFKTQPSVAYGFEQQQNTFNRAFGPLKLSGYILSPSASSTGSLIVTSGTAYAPGANYTVDPNEPYYAVDNGTTISKIFRYHQSGSTWIYDTNAAAGYTTINPGQYSNNGVLTTVQPNDWSIQRVFWFPNSVVKAIVVYYGNASYSTEADAIANISIESFVEAPNTSANAIYLGAIVIKGNGVLTTAADFTIVPGGLFRQVGGSGGGGSIITQTLSGLSDVLISGPTNGQPLVYNNTSAKWQNSSTLTANLTGNASTATSASFATTASYVNPLNQIVELTGSLQIQNNVDTAARTLFDTNNTSSLNWESRYLYDNIGNISVDWKDKKLYDSNVDNSILWHARQLIKSDGTTITLDWENATFTGSVLGTASFAQKASTVTISNDVDTRIVTANGDSTLNAEGNLTFNGQTLSVLYGVGDEGGEILLGKAATNTTLTGSGVTVDVFQNKLRFFEQGGSARGFYLDISTGGGGASTNLASGGGTVTSVSASGTVSGITLGGGPITGAGTLTLTGTISGLTTSNLSATAGILNAQLANSSITIGSTNIDLGDTATTLAGLTSISATSFTGSLLGTASYANNSLSSSFATTALTASYVNDLNQNLTINGNFIVNGSASYTYVTASNLDVGTNFISVNVAEPAERFGGLRVYDSGSLSHLATASLAWDSLKNHWIYQNASGSTYSGGMLLAGPRNTGSLGDEPSLTRWFVARSDGGDHLDNTQIFSSASIHIITGSAVITGSLGATGSFSVQTYNGISDVTALSFDGVTRLINDVQGNQSINADDRDLYDSANINSIGWESRRLLDDSGLASIRWALRSAYDTVDSQSIAWDARLLKIDNGPASYTVNWGSGILRDTGAKNSVDWENRTTIDTGNKNSIDWQNRQLKNTSATEVLNWQSGVTITGATKVTGSLESTGSFKVQGEGTGFTGPYTAIEVDDVNFTRKLYDFNVGSGSLDFGNRDLLDSNGNGVFNWNGVAKTIDSRLYLNETVSGATRNALITNVGYGGFALNDAEFDTAVQANDLVFLDTDGIWYQVDQATNTSTKMLGICQGYDPMTYLGTVITEGDIVVTTGTGYPLVQSANYGLPVYIRQSGGTLMSTVIPTTGYVRLLGHCYHNAGGTEWIMKFRPSHEWIEL